MLKTYLTSTSGRTFEFELRHRVDSNDSTMLVVWVTRQHVLGTVVVFSTAGGEDVVVDGDGYMHDMDPENNEFHQLLAEFISTAS